MSIAHLSDPHLRTDAVSAGPAEALHRALGTVLAIDPRPDCVVITGDLSEYRHDAYAQLAGLLDGYPIPVHLVMGNHDDASALTRVFGGTPFLGGTHETRYVVDHETFSVVVLDSWRPDSPGGLLGSEQLSWLDDVIVQRDRPVVVALHHPPVDVGIPFLDGMKLEDGDRLAEVLRRHPRVVRVLAGHVHRVVSAPFAGTLVCTAPSTHRQSTLALRPAQPMGYLHEPAAFLLHAGVRPEHWVTHVVPVGALVGGWRGSPPRATT
ncbi:phosphodiesterase [Saccharothrix variisporea]|uniref:3',5'-cyclic AMP phosphodiesterase CpdA n=1 Tax=Saccharothrix variisporea TaxID=543527 RepID=A0A495X9Z5_9PSEU|nr:phosphodiesterase [Saccharothrix variisporea]RKT71070.1 3',5'-cyclic AMP phosphodiesterase CpdA [Saccharothrix variisporea]